MKKADSGSPVGRHGARGLAILAAVSVTVMAGACDSAPARPDYAELHSLPSVEPDAWFTSVVASHSSLSAELGHVKGSARLGTGEVAIFSNSGGDCGFAFRSSDGVEDAFSGEAPSDSAGVGSVADEIDPVQLAKELKGSWSVAEGLSVTAEPLAGQSGAPVPVGAFCGDRYAALILPRSFADGSAGTAQVQGATSERALPDGRLVIVVSDDRIRDRVGAAIERLANAAPEHG